MNRWDAIVLWCKNQVQSFVIWTKNNVQSFSWIGIGTLAVLTLWAVYYSFMPNLTSPPQLEVYGPFQPARSFILYWIFGTIASVAIGLILMQNAYLKLSGQVLVVLGVLSMVWGGIEYFPSLIETKDWTTLTFIALVATIVTVAIFNYGFYRIYSDGPGNTAKNLAYGFLALCVLGAGLYYLLGEDIFSMLVMTLTNSTREAVKTTLESEKPVWKLPDFTWTYLLPSLAFAVIVAFAFWPQTETKEKEGGHH